MKKGIAHVGISLLLIGMAAGCSAGIGALPDDLYTQDVLPGTEGVNVGSEDLPYNDGWFTSLFINSVQVPASTGNTTAFLRGDYTWASPVSGNTTGLGDMLKAVYDTEDDGAVDALASSGPITIKPSGDTDDFFSLTTVADVPTITATGASWLALSGSVVVNGVYFFGGYLQTPAGYLMLAGGVDNEYASWYARDNGVGHQEILRFQGAADPFVRIGRDDTGVATASVTDMLVLQAGAGTNNEAAGFGLGVSFKLGNAASEVEERASLDAVLVTATNGSEDSRFDFSTMTGGAMGVGMSLDRGALVPASDNTGSIGTASLRWNLVRAVTITPGDLAWEEWQDPITGTPYANGDVLVLLVTGVETEEVETIVGHRYETVTKTRPMTRDIFDKDGMTVIGSENFTETYTEVIDIPITKTETVHTTRTVPVLLSTILKNYVRQAGIGQFDLLKVLSAPYRQTRTGTLGLK